MRHALEQEAARLGVDHLYTELKRVDATAARQITPNNLRRIIRALEVYRRLGVPISQLQTKAPPPYRILIIGLTRSLENLHLAIARRVDEMIAAGLVGEVQALVERGFGYDLPAMSGIGYREIGMYLRGEIDLGYARGTPLRRKRGASSAGNTSGSTSTTRRSIGSTSTNLRRRTQIVRCLLDFGLAPASRDAWG